MALFPPAPLGGEQVAHGYKGKGVLSHLLSDAQGHPLAWMSTAANGDERLQVQPLLQKVNAYLPKDEHNEPIILEADRGYDARSLRRSLLGQLIYPLIPYRRMKFRPGYKLEMTSFRWRIERTFSWLKVRYRRFLCRFEKSIAAWQALLDCVLIHYWLQNLER